MTPHLGLVWLVCTATLTAGGRHRFWNNKALDHSDPAKKIHESHPKLCLDY